MILLLVETITIGKTVIAGFFLNRYVSYLFVFINKSLSLAAIFLLL
jgi:hypothetical protein